MILLKQIFKSFITISLVLLISMATALSVMVENSYASILLISSINTLSNKIAWGNKDIEIGGKNLEGKTEVEMEESQQLDRQTQDAMSNAIQNPNYKPEGKTRQAEKESRQATKDIKAEANDAMLSN